MRPAFNYRAIVAFAFLSFIMLSAVSAQTLKDMFTNSETPVFYYGVDFSKAKVIDDPKSSAADIRDNKFAAINQLIISNADKFDLKAAFNRTVEHDISAVNAKNEKANTEAIMSSNSADFHRFKESDIDAAIKGLETGGKNVIGLVFVVEAMSKSAKAMAVWVTFFNPKTKKVLMTERMEGKPGGFGFHSYWAASIRDVLNDIKKKKYSEWKSKYGG